MIKHATFRGVSESGEVLCQPLLSGSFEKTAATSNLHPKIKDFVGAVRPTAKGIYVLVNALGAGEYWGSNVNGDLFPESSLIHSPPDWDEMSLEEQKQVGATWDYGFPTFYNAGAYKHHQNKDKSKAFGTIEVAAWNPKMRRVELVVYLDRALCKQFGAYDIIERVERGEFPDVSMGCIPAGTKILLANGSHKLVEEMTVGDTVISHMGRPKRVNETYSWPNKSGSVFNFKFYGLATSLPLTGNHPLWLVRKEDVACKPSSKSVNRGRLQHVCAPNGPTTKRGCADCSTKPTYKFDWVRADEADVGDYAAFPVPTFSESLDVSRPVARLLGYYLAEGHILSWNRKPDTGIQLSVGLHETKLHEDIHKCAEEAGLSDKLSYWDNLEDNCRWYSINDQKLAALCKTHCGKYAKTKKLSEAILGANVDILKEFLGAYANGDGGSYNGALYFSTASEELANQLVVALARCRMIASVHRIVHKPSRKSVVKIETVEYQVWCGTDTCSNLNTSLKDLRTSKKMSSKRFFYEHEGVTYLMTPIEEIDEEEHTGKVYNFSVEGDDSYIAAGVATHNTKVPSDFCSICMTESKTRFDYCEHLRTQMNKILPDGRKVCAVNKFPKFFDISFVFIGADKTAKVMAKLASDGKQNCLGDYCTIPAPLEKTASLDGALSGGGLGAIAGTSIAHLTAHLAKLPDKKMERLERILTAMGTLTGATAGALLVKKGASYSNEELNLIRFRENKLQEQLAKEFIRRTQRLAKKSPDLYPNYHSGIGVGYDRQSPHEKLDQINAAIKRPRDFGEFETVGSIRAQKAALLKEYPHLVKGAEQEKLASARRRLTSAAIGSAVGGTGAAGGSHLFDRIKGEKNKKKMKDEAARDFLSGATSGALTGALFPFTKRASGDMLEYFQKHPQKLKEKLERDKAKKEKTANDPIKKKIEVAGVPVWIEWKKGETRQYKKNGKVKHSRFMKADYGYIPETRDADGEEIDVYVGPNHKSATAWVIRQLKKTDGSFDENKVMMGYDSERHARASYDYHMGGAKEFFGGIHKVPVSSLRALFGENGSSSKTKTAENCSCDSHCDPCGGSLEKVAEALFGASAEKSASHRKLSEIIKSIPAGPFSKETLPKLESAERDIPNDVLDLMGGLPLGASMSTPGMMGMVLKPREFQRIVLIRMGERGLANELDKKQMTFAPTDKVDDSIPMGSEHVDPRLKELLSLLGFMKDRSAASPALSRRTTNVSRGRVPTAKREKAVADGPVMEKMAAAYNGYRRSMLLKAASIQDYLTLDSQLRSDLFGESMAQAFACGIDKVASSANVLSPDSIAYLVGAYTDRSTYLSSEVVSSIAQTGAVRESI